MKRVLYGLMMAAVGVAGCGSKTPTAPTNQPTVFTVPLKASSEVPPVTNAEANAGGTATITVNTVKDSGGNVVSGTVDFSVTMNGFPNGSTAVAAHIHPGAAGVTGSPVVNTGLTAGTGVAMPSGTGTLTFTGIPVSADQVNQILANPQSFYFNVHTTLNPSGAIRGQLK